MTKKLFVILCSVMVFAVSAEATRPGSGRGKGKAKADQAAKEANKKAETKIESAKDKEAKSQLEAKIKEAGVKGSVELGLREMVGHKELQNPIENFLAAKNTLSKREGEFGDFIGQKNQSREALQMIETIAERIGQSPSAVKDAVNREAYAALVTQLAMVAKGNTTGLTEADVTRISNYGREFLSDAKAFEAAREVMNRIAKETIGPCKGVGKI